MGTPDPIELVILAIVREARHHGVAPLSRTMLHKLVYLLDVYVAQSAGGRTFTGADWQFLHFGPCSTAVMRGVDRLVEQGLLSLDLRSNDESDREMGLIDLRRDDVYGLRDLGLATGIPLRLSSDVRRFAYDLPAMLDHVYFRTAPMQVAEPGDTLSFDSCEPIRPQDYKPVEMKPLPTKALASARAKLQSQLHSRQQLRGGGPTIGPFDEVYAAAVAAMDGEDISTGVSGVAYIASD